MLLRLGVRVKMTFRSVGPLCVLLFFFFFFLPCFVDRRPDADVNEEGPVETDERPAVEKRQKEGDESFSFFRGFKTHRQQKNKIKAKIK